MSLEEELVSHLVIITGFSHHACVMGMIRNLRNKEHLGKQSRPTQLGPNTILPLGNASLPVVLKMEQWYWKSWQAEWLLFSYGILNRFFQNAFYIPDEHIPYFCYKIFYCKSYLIYKIKNILPLSSLCIDFYVANYAFFSNYTYII